MYQILLLHDRSLSHTTILLSPLENIGTQTKRIVQHVDFTEIMNQTVPLPQWVTNTKTVLEPTL